MFYIPCTFRLRLVRPIIDLTCKVCLTTTSTYNKQTKKKQKKYTTNKFAKMEKMDSATIVSLPERFDRVKS